MKVLDDALARLYLPLTGERGCQKQQNLAGTTEAHAQLLSSSFFVMFLLSIEAGKGMHCLIGYQEARI